MNLIRSKNGPLDSRQLLSFVTIARTGSFTQAGKELFISQSAVSHALKALEDELGHRLLDRAGKKMQITPAGEHLLHYAEKILKDMSLARISLDQRARWGSSRLRVGTTGSFCPCLLPGILQSFRREFPNGAVSVKIGDTRECVEWINQNVIDVGIGIAPSRAVGVEFTALFVDEVMWMVAPSHPWAQGNFTSGGDIQSQTVICCDSESHTTHLLENYFKRDGIRLNYALELANLQAIKEMVKDGAGITALAPWAVKEELQENSLVMLPLGKRKLKRNWCLLRSADRKADLAQEKFGILTLAATKALSSLMNSTVALATLSLMGSWMDFAIFAVAV